MVTLYFHITHVMLPLFSRKQYFSVHCSWNTLFTSSKFTFVIHGFYLGSKFHIKHMHLIITMSQLRNLVWNKHYPRTFFNKKMTRNKTIIFARSHTTHRHNVMSKVTDWFKMQTDSCDNWNFPPAGNTDRNALAQNATIAGSGPFYLKHQ
jgi:hypothetical protein